MKPVITLGTAIIAALAIAACGGGASGGASAGAPGAAGAGTSSNTVSVRQLSGVGSVLVDGSGRALYANDLESGGKIACDSAACNSFWKPVTPGGANPTASAGAGKLGVITRPDGSRQVTVSGKPVYTFSEDSPGKATGDGFMDDFSGHHFTWNVVRGDGTTASASGPSSGAGAASSAGAPSGAGAQSGNYGY